MHEAHKVRKTRSTWGPVSYCPINWNPFFFFKKKLLSGAPLFTLFTRGHHGGYAAFFNAGCPRGTCVSS